MDPLSITAGCVALTATATKLAETITRFVRDVRAARGDLDAVSRELGSLQLILLTLEDEFQDDGSRQSVDIPDTLRKQIHDMVGNCQAVLKDIDNLLEQQKSSRIGEASKWTLTGRADVRKLQVSLEAHRSALDIALELVNVHTTKSIKKDTTEVVETTRDIKYDTEQILMEIERLREQLPKNGHNNFMLERYLDQLTSYAETVVDGNESLGEAVPESPRIDPDLADASSAELDMPTFEHEEQDQATSFSHAAQDQAARQEGGLTTAMKQVKIRPVDERALLEGDENEEILARIRIADDHETDALAWETTSRPQLQFRSRKQAALSLSSQTRQPKLAGKRGSDENLRRAAQRDAPEEHIDTQAPAPDHTDETGDTSIQKVARSVSRELSSARNVPSPPPGGQVLPRPMESSKAQRSERQHYTSRQNDRIRELILIQETSTYREYYEGLQYSDISKTQFQAQAANVINSGFRFQYRTRSSLKLTVVLTSFPQEADKVVASRGTRLLSVPFYAEDPYKIVQSMHSELGLSVGEMMLVVHDHQSVAQHQESLNYIGFKHSLKPEALSTFLQSTLRVHDKRRVNSHPREVLFLRICEHNFDPMKAHITETALAMSLKPRMTIHTHSLAAVLSHKKEIRQAFYDMIAQGVGMRGVYWLKPRMLGTHKLVRARHQGEQSGVPMF